MDSPFIRCPVDHVLNWNLPGAEAARVRISDAMGRVVLDEHSP
jgi:hypothetical protein